MTYHILSADILLIICGLLTFSMALFGLCGAWFQNKYLLGIYLMMIILIMILEIICGTIGFFGREKIKETVRDELMLSVKEKYTVNDTNGIETFWDYMHFKFNCCGVDNYMDWYNIKAWPNSNQLPHSCCIPVSAELPATLLIKANETNLCPKNERIRKDGCYVKFRRWILENLHVIAITCVVFSFIQFFAIVASLLMIYTMDYKKNYRPMSNGRTTYNRVPTLRSR